MKRKNDNTESFRTVTYKKICTETTARLSGSGLLLLCNAAEFIKKASFKPIDASSKTNFTHSETGPFIPFKK